MYVIRKNQLDVQKTQKLRSELTARPFAPPGTVSQCYPVYLESPSAFVVPKMYGITNFGAKDFKDYPWTLRVDFSGELRDSQLEPVQNLLDSLERCGGGILSLSTGMGKTISAIYVLSKLRCRAIVVVNKISLLEQWKKEIAMFIPNARVGTIQGPKNTWSNPEECHITVAMLQTLAKQTDTRIAAFGVCVVDECHNLSSTVFSRVLFKVSSKYNIGLSATPKRADGLESVFKMHLGEIVFKSAPEARKGLQTVVKLVTPDIPGYTEYTQINKLTGLPQLQFTKMLSDLVTNTHRNKIIVELIREHAADPKRKILVLSDRRGHLETLRKQLCDTGVTNTGLFLGAMKIETLNESRKAQVILATYNAFAEGVSEKDLNTLILVTPKKYTGHIKRANSKQDSGRLEQICGRIFRKVHTDVNPVIIDITDSFSLYKSQAAGRKVYYTKCLVDTKIEMYSCRVDESGDVVVSEVKGVSKKRGVDVDVSKCVL